MAKKNEGKFERTNLALLGSFGLTMVTLIGACATFPVAAGVGVAILGRAGAGLVCDGLSDIWIQRASEKDWAEYEEYLKTKFADKENVIDV